MRLTGIKPGDIVEADVRGRRFYGKVEEMTSAERAETRGKAVIAIKSCGRGHLEILSSRQVVGHYRKAAGSR